MALYFRDSHGAFLVAGNGLLLVTEDAQTTETLSLRETLSWVKDRGMTNVVFEIDA